VIGYVESLMGMQVGRWTAHIVEDSTHASDERAVTQAMGTRMALHKHK
jgi:hypothetical protein